jgi:hypothetical protein
MNKPWVYLGLALLAALPAARLAAADKVKLLAGPQSNGRLT